MDKVYEKLINSVKNVEQYDSVTQEIMNKYKNMKVNNNMTTALAITKVRSLEIEYFSKFHENGAASFLFESLLSLPPSKTWGIMKKELISSLQYWLQAIKNRLLSYRDIWWKFLKLILKFIKEIRVKDPSVPNKLVELTADSLFDIATQDGLNEMQRHEILHCLCLYCAESGREVRIALRPKFSDYFAKLARLMVSCGYVPLQQAALEALVRWLVPRAAPGLREAAAALWLPREACPDAAREIFLTTTWCNFIQDARNFLNILNDASGLVFSVLCKRLFVGEQLIISGSESQQTWLDINFGVGCVSALIDPRVRGAGVVLRAGETLVVEDASTDTVRLHRESEELTLSVSMLQPPRALPSGASAGASRDVTALISSRTDLRRLDDALRAVFRDKYRVELNIDAGLPLSPTREIKKTNTSSEESRFSHPVEVKQRRPIASGVAYKSFGNRFRPESLASPSTTSTTSLAQLHDNLEALQRARYTTEYEKVCAKPQLSTVTEISETDDLHSIHSRSTLQYGVAYRSKKAESDSELLKQKSGINTRRRSASVDEREISCLLVATLGTDESVINDTIEHLSKSKDFETTNIVDLIVQEALEAEIARDKIKDSINSEERKIQGNEDNSEAIENTPNEILRENPSKSRVAKKKSCIVVSKSTTEDESNTEAFSETQAYVTTRRTKKRPQSNSTSSESKKAEESFHAQHVEDFFSQHIVETRQGKIRISPKLARKINASTSNTSESFDENSLIVNYDLNMDMEHFDTNDIDIIECLNDMVDKVCKDLMQYSSKDHNTQENSSGEAFANIQANTESNSHPNTPKQIRKQTRKPAFKSKMNVNAKNDKKSKSVAKKIKRDSTNKNSPTKNPAKMSTIIEHNDEEIIEISSPKRNVPTLKKIKINNPVITKQDKESPAAENLVARRKRKLYSPKDDKLGEEKKDITLSDTEGDNISLAVFKKRNRTETPKRSSTCYKEIEKERGVKRRIRLPQARKSRGNFDKSASPSTLENDALFDKLKTTVENDEKFILVDKKSALDVYNFSSEDSDFEVKRIESRKRLNSKMVVSSESSMSVKPGKQKTRRNISGKSSNDEAKKKKQLKKKVATKRTNIKSKAAISIEPAIELDDERMRAAPEEELNTSLVAAEPNVQEPPSVVLVLDDPQMEPIIDDLDLAPKRETKRKKLNKRSKSAFSLKKDNDLKTPSGNDSGTLSPLPGLLVEAVSKRKDNDLSMEAMGRKIQQICEDPDGINETSNTQNMLLFDNEKCNSPQNVFVDITNENCYAEKTPIERSSNISKKAKLTHKLKAKIIRQIKKEKLSQNNTDAIIEIPETYDMRSEKSFSTDGIRAHVNSDERPPSTGMLERTIPSREIVDMDDLTKEFFVKLHQELYDSPLTSAEQERSKDCEIGKASRLSSISSYRPSFDIRKMLPSRRTSVSSYSASSSKNIDEPKSMRLQQIMSKDTTQLAKQNTTVKSPKEKTPIVSVVRLSIEDIERLTTPRSLPQSDTSSKTKAKHSPRFFYNTRKFKNIATISDDATSEETIVKTKEDYCMENTKYASKSAKNIGHLKSGQSKRSTQAIRSTISPINMDCIIPQNHDSDLSSPITKKVSNQKIKLNTLALAGFIQNLSPDESIEIQIPSQSKDSQQKSTPTKFLDEPKQATKRRNVSPIRHAGKRSRFHPNVDTTGSGPSVASVNDWFRRNETSQQDTDSWAIVGDMLNSLSEKIDTSLVESNQNTSKMILEFFIEVQTQFSNHQVKQRELYETAIAAAEAAVAAASTVKKSEEMMTKFMERLKKNVADVIRRDRANKELLAAELAGEVRAAQDRVKRGELC